MSRFERFALALLFIALFHVHPANAAPLQPDEACLNTPTAEDAALAAAWAPVIVQAIDAPFRRDYLTRFDYDGDHDPDNNWISPENSDKAGAGKTTEKTEPRQVSNKGPVNAIKHDMPSSVYYWVIRGDDCDYVGYGLYYLLDEKGQTHDFRATVLALKKDTATGGHRLCGMLVWDPEAGALIPGAARKDWKNAAGESAALIKKGPYRPRVKTQSRAEALAGFVEPPEASGSDDSAVRNLDIVIDDRGLHPVLYAGGRDHELLLRSPYPDLLFHFSVESWDDWRGRKFQEQDYPNAKSGQGHFLSYPQFGVVYHPREKAHTVAKKGVHAQGRLWHHWELVGYELLPLSSAAAGDRVPCTDADRRDDIIQQQQVPLIANTVAILAGAGKKDIGKGKRLDPLLLSNPAPLFKTHFKVCGNSKAHVRVRW